MQTQRWYIQHQEIAQTVRSECLYSTRTEWLGRGARLLDRVILRAVAVAGGQPNMLLGHHWKVSPALRGQVVMNYLASAEIQGIPPDLCDVIHEGRGGGDVKAILHCTSPVQ